MTKPKTVYIVDDDAALRTAYAAELTRLGYMVQEAEEGSKGLALLETGHPDLILLDMLMPNMDGLTFLRELRSNAKNADIKVVVISSFEAMPEAETLGIEKFMSKMRSLPDEVAAAIDTILKATD